MERGEPSDREVVAKLHRYQTKGDEVNLFIGRGLCSLSAIFSVHLVGVL